MAEKEIEKEVKKIIKIEKTIKKLSKNYWKISTIVLAVILIAVLFLNTSSISKSSAGEKTINFLNSQTGGGVTLVQINDADTLYEVIVSYQGQQIPVYITKDGKNLVQGVVPLDSPANTNTNTNTQTIEVPKSDKPVVELFIMSYCPYGTQAEKGILPVVALLGNKIDFKLRTVHYVLHGDKEDLENKRQLCIREEQGQTKLNKYLVCILNSTNVQAPANVTACEKTAGIDSAKLQTCLSTKADDYFTADSALSQSYGIQGSPTLIINGVIASSSRSPAAYLNTICSAFNTAPAECSETLSSSSPSAGFGYNEGVDTVAQC